MKTALALLALALAGVGCATEKRFIRYLEHTKGTSYKDLLEHRKLPQSYHYRIGWVERYTILANGNREYEDPEMDSRCTIYWEVDKNWTIVGYRYAGNNCKLEPDLL